MLTYTSNYSGGTLTTRTFTWTGTGGINTDSRQGGTTGVSFGYGGRDMLHAFSINGTLESTMLFTAQGERAWKWDNGVNTTNYHYDENRHLIAESIAVSTLTYSMQKEYVWLYDLPIAEIDASGTPSIKYVHTDQLGTPKKITNATPTMSGTASRSPSAKSTTPSMIPPSGPTLSTSASPASITTPSRSSSTTAHAIIMKIWGYISTPIPSVWPEPPRQ
jgi:hypothetical protein